MNFERFIAYRIGVSGEKKFSAMIIRVAVVAVALSVVVMIMTSSVITGFKNQISSKVFSFWGHIHITDGNSTDTFELIPIEDREDLVDRLLKMDKVTHQVRGFMKPDIGSIQTSKGGVSAVEPFIIVPGIVSSQTNFEGLLLKGIRRDFDVERIAEFIREGKFISFEADNASRDLVISEQTAKRMNFEVGQRVILHFILEGEQIKRAFTISGIYKTGLEEYDQRFALVDMRILQDILEWEADMISGYEVYIDDLDDLAILNDYIYFEELTGELGHLTTQSIRSKFFQIFEWLDLQNINERVIYILMILVAVINMVTALLIFVLERVQMIGILKTMGATNWSIRRIFLYNAGVIIGRGLVIGNMLAITLCLIQRYTGIFKLREQDYYLSTVPIEFNIPVILLINVGSIVVILLFLVLPSTLVTQITPVKAVHFR